MIICAITRAELVERYGTHIREWVATLERLFERFSVTADDAKYSLLAGRLPRTLRYILRTELEVKPGGNDTHGFLKHRILWLFPVTDHGGTLLLNPLLVLHMAMGEQNEDGDVKWEWDDYPGLSLKW